MGLSAGGYRLFIKLRTYFMGTARVWCSLFIRFLKLTSRKLSAWVESLYGFQTYLQGTVQPTSRGLSAIGAFFFMVTKPSSRGPLAGGEYRLFIRLRTYFQGSKSRVQSVYKVS